jgi:hypothetical protein
MMTMTMATTTIAPPNCCREQLLAGWKQGAMGGDDDREGEGDRTKGRRRG